MVECVWALLRPAGQTGKGGVGIEVLLSYSKAAFSIGLSGLQKKTAHFFLGARRRAVAFAYSKWIPRFGTLGNTIGWAGRVSNAPLPLLQLLRPRSGSRKQFVAKTFRPGGTLEDYYKAKGGGMVPRYATYSSHSCPGSGSKKQFVKKHDPRIRSGHTA